MAITSPIAGAYTSTWNGSALAYTRQGFRLSFTHKAERIEESDIYGLSLIEIIYRGAQMTVDAIFRVYSLATRGALMPWAATFGQTYAAASPISQLATVLNKSLVLTVVASTPAASGLGPTTLTANPTVLSPDQNFELVFNSTIREVPLRWDCLTSDNAGTGSMFTTT